MGKYSSVGVIRSGSKKRRRRVRVEDSRDGSTAGFQIEHWSGRVDAVATPKAARPKVRTQDRGA